MPRPVLVLLPQIMEKSLVDTVKEPPANRPSRLSLRRPHLTQVRLFSVVSIVVVVATISTLLIVHIPHTHNRPYVYQPAALETVVTTYRGSNTRIGWYAHETALTVENVGHGHLSRQVVNPVDGQVYAQPLYVPDLEIGGKPYNVVFVATEHDSVYAFDADQKTAEEPIWHTGLLAKDAKPASTEEVFGPSNRAIYPEVGITSTPVIDLSYGTMYVVATSSEHGQIIQRLYALDIATGHIIKSTMISAAVPGTGIGSVSGSVAFNAREELQRAALLLVNGVVYVAWASYGDREPFHGWLMAYETQTLAQRAVMLTTPNGEDGGIWASGNGLAARADGSIFLSTGDGTFDLDKGGKDAGDSVLRVDAKLNILDYFAPDLQDYYNKYDLDIGSAGMMILPPQPNAKYPNILITAGKDGRIYLLNQDNLGHFNRYPDLIVQEFPSKTLNSVFSTPAYWEGSSRSYVYFAGVGDPLKVFELQNGQLSQSPVSQTRDTFNYPGGNPVVSSNGSQENSGIVWVTTPDGPAKGSAQPGALHAFDATDLSHELFKGTFAQYIKFTVPTVANGQVFVGTGNSLDIYGLSN